MGEWAKACDRHNDPDVVRDGDTYARLAVHRILTLLHPARALPPSRHGVEVAGSLIRAWRRSLDTPSDRLPPFADYQGDERLWRAGSITMHLRSRPSTTVGPLAYGLRMVEAELRQWWHENREDGGPLGDQELGDQVKRALRRAVDEQQLVPEHRKRWMPAIQNETGN